jgi:hypothetical protein
MDRGRHEVLGFLAGISEHHALVAGTLLFRGLAVHTLSNVSGLLVHGGDDGTGLPVEAHVRAVIADVLDGLPGDLGEVGEPAGGDFSGHKDQSGGDQGFAGHPGFGVLGDEVVQDRVRDPVGNLVRVTFGHGLRGEHVFSFFSYYHGRVSFFFSGQAGFVNPSSC